jgi:hypothetical protein
MAQISKGDTFVDGQQVTGARLNQLVDSSVLLVGAITDQPSITANTLEATDTTLVNDAGVLKEATIGDILNSNLPVTTSSITSGAGVDLALTPSAGQKIDIVGNAEVDDLTVTDDLTVSGDAGITGTLTVTGSSTLIGNVIVDNGFTSNGVANFTGTLQVGGTVGYVLYEVATIALPTTQISRNNTGLTSVFTTSTFTKPSDEIWVFKCDFWYTCNGYPFQVGVRYTTQTIGTGSYLAGESRQDAGGAGLYVVQRFQQEWVVGAGTALTSVALSIDNQSGSGQFGMMFVNAFSQDGIGGITGNFSTSKISIYKYKTA